MIEKDILMSVAALGFNAPVFFFTRRLHQAIDFKHITAEKDGSTVSPPDGGDTPVAPGSSSRVASVLVSIVLCCFLWGIGNYIIYAAFFEPEKIQTFLSSIYNFFVAGMTLYAPYSVNKLTSAFKS